MPSSLGLTSAICANYFKNSRAGNLLPSAWKCSPWACLTTLRLPSKRDRLAFASGPQSLERENLCGAPLERWHHCVIMRAISANASTCCTGQVQAFLVISAANVVFSKTPVGSKLPPMAITVSNPTGSTILLEEVIVSGIDFAETTDCGKELAPGAKCSIQIVFQPATLGERIGNLIIA